MNAFQDWILSKGGIETVANKLGVKPLSVQYWYYRRGRPKAQNILKIIDMAKGALSFEDIYESCSPPDQVPPPKKKRK